MVTKRDQIGVKSKKKRAKGGGKGGKSAKTISETEAASKIPDDDDEAPEMEEGIIVTEEKKKGKKMKKRGGKKGLKRKRSIMVSPSKRRRRMLKAWPVPEESACGLLEYEVATFPDPEEEEEPCDTAGEAEPEREATPKRKSVPKVKAKPKGHAKAKATAKATAKAKAKAAAKATAKAKAKATAKTKAMPRARRALELDDDEDARISVDDALVNYLAMTSVEQLQKAMVEFAEIFAGEEQSHSLKLRMKAELAQSTACSLTHYWTRCSTGVLVKESKKELVNLSVAGGPKDATWTAKMAMTMKAGELVSIAMDGLIADSITNPWIVTKSVEADSIIMVIKEQLLQALLTLSRAK